MLKRSTYILISNRFDECVYNYADGGINFLFAALKFRAAKWNIEKCFVPLGEVIFGQSSEFLPYSLSDYKPFNQR